MTMNRLCVLSLTTLLMACASAPATDALPASTTSASATQDAPNLSGTWRFDLDASEVAASVRERCAKSSEGDTAKAEACWKQIATEAGREKIRFTKDTAGHTLWTSFGAEGSKEIVFVEVPVEVAADGPNRVLMKVTGAPKGDHASQFAKSNTNAIRIDVVDAHTIAMNDPKKGRLVFSKETSP